MQKNIVFLVAAIAMTACSPTVKVQAPQEPIVIDLNIKIEHNVKVQIDKDLDNMMDNNDGLF